MNGYYGTLPVVFRFIFSYATTRLTRSLNMLTVSMKIRLLLVTTVSRRNDKERQLYLACEQLCNILSLSIKQLHPLSVFSIIPIMLILCNAKLFELLLTKVA